MLPQDAGGRRVFFGVQTCDAVIETVEKLGGTLLDGPVDSPFGRIASIAALDGATSLICAMSEARPEG